MNWPTWKAVNWIINAHDNIDTFFKIRHFSPGDNFTFSLIETVSSVLRSGGYIFGKNEKKSVEKFFIKNLSFKGSDCWWFCSYLNWVVTIVPFVIISWTECHFYIQSETREIRRNQNQWKVFRVCNELVFWIVCYTLYL